MHYSSWRAIALRTTALAAAAGIVWLQAGARDRREWPVPPDPAHRYRLVLLGPDGGPSEHSLDDRASDGRLVDQLRPLLRPLFGGRAGSARQVVGRFWIEPPPVGGKFRPGDGTDYDLGVRAWLSRQRLVLGAAGEEGRYRVEDWWSDDDDRPGEALNPSDNFEVLLWTVVDRFRWDVRNWRAIAGAFGGPAH